MLLVVGLCRWLVVAREGEGGMKWQDRKNWFVFFLLIELAATITIHLSFSFCFYFAHQTSTLTLLFMDYNEHSL